MAPYQAEILRGIRTGANERGLSLVVLVGGVLGAPDVNGYQRNHLFQLADPQQLDGLIVLGGTLGNYQGVESLQRACAPFRNKPLVSIAVEVPGHALVEVDNKSGIRDAVEHLIRVHGYNRIAFIRGPEANTEAEARYEAYQQALEANGIALDERLVAPGVFQHHCGESAVRLWCDERKIPLTEIDAIIGAADLMVLGALDELTRRGVRVPDEVALVGFDDIEEARFSTPPLSTIRQPLFEQGREAVRILMDQLNGNASAEHLRLAPRFVGRRSCGCLSRERTERSDLPSDSKLSLRAALISRRAILRAELSRASQGMFSAAGSGWEERLLNALAEELGGTSGAFVDAYYHVVQSVLTSAGELSVCHAVIDALRRQLRIATGDDVTTLNRVESLLHELRIITSEALERFQAHQRIQANDSPRQVAIVSTQLAAVSDIAGLEHCMREQIPRLGIRTCFVARYVDDERVELLAGYTDSGAKLLPKLRYAAHEIIPRTQMREWSTWQLAVLPIVFDERPFGYIAFEMGRQDAHVYESLCTIIGAMLRGFVRDMAVGTSKHV